MVAHMSVLLMQMSLEWPTPPVKKEHFRAHLSTRGEDQVGDDGVDVTPAATGTAPLR